MKNKKIIFGVGLVGLGLLTVLKSKPETIAKSETKATSGGNIPFKTIGFLTIIAGSYLIFKN